MISYPDALTALRSVDFNSTQSLDDIWSDEHIHVEEIHGTVAGQVFDNFRWVIDGRAQKRKGTIIQGQRGSGKTHLLGQLRRRVLGEGHYFILVELIDSSTFWRSVALGFLNSLQRESPPGATQLGQWGQRMAEKLSLEDKLAAELLGACEISPKNLEELRFRLSKIDGHTSRFHADVFRALILFGQPPGEAADVGYSFLQGLPLDDGVKSHWGFSANRIEPQRITQGISKVLGITGATMVAFDQLDSLIGKANFAAEASGDQANWAKAEIEEVTGGLMQVYDTTVRAISVLSCLIETVKIIEARATASMPDRFWMPPLQLGNIAQAEHARKLVRRRLSRGYQLSGFEPPYPTWPILPSAFDHATDYTARRLIDACWRHVHECVTRDEVRELQSFKGPDLPPISPTALEPGFLEEIDARFEQLKADASIGAALAKETEDTALPPLLRAGLNAWIRERPDNHDTFTVDPDFGPRKPPIHARLRRTLEDETETEVHWAFRGIAHSNANAMRPRLAAAVNQAGIGPTSPNRYLFILRSAAWPGGAATEKVIAEFSNLGGQKLPLEEDDLRVFAALQNLLSNPPGGLEQWLRECRPASNTTLLKTSLAVEENVSGNGHEPPYPEPIVQPMPFDSGTGSIPIGRALPGGQGIRSIDLEIFRRHLVIFAGSGSGKTVLIRRIVEEAALQGVSSIVLDTNNDLARLGDPWPAPPDAWTEGDPEKAAAYFRGTEVVIWTPGREHGRPMSFQPLPDFAAVADDTDAFNQAIEMTVSALIPRTQVEGATQRAHQGRAVLKLALVNFAKGKGGCLAEFAAYLAEGASESIDLPDSPRIARTLSANLKAAMVNDPMFGSGATPLDPEKLLTPSPGKKARISVISFIGLPNDEMRQNFVNQMEMSLFSWVKRHPAVDRPLGGLFVLDEAQNFAPSGKATPCLSSTLALVSQARKYGLGLVFATQAPKGLHNQIPGNATTQFYGLLNAPVQINAAKELAATKGGTVDDIGLLKIGQFYVSSEHIPLQKVQTPLCLSYHPKQPLTEEEVLARTQ